MLGLAIRSGIHYIIATGSFYILFSGKMLVAQPASYRLEPVSLEQGVSHNLIYCIKQDRQGFLWFGTMLGLVKYDGYTYTTFRHDPNDSTSLSNDDILALYEDRQQNLWIGTYGGLNLLARGTGKFVRYIHAERDSSSLANNVIWAITEDRSGAIWLATNGGGLNRFDKTNRRFTPYQHQADNLKSLPSDTVYAVYEDRRGEIWVGTQRGLAKFDREQNCFVRYAHLPENPQSLSHNVVKTILEDHWENLWIGTEGGLNKFRRELGTFVHYRRDPANPASLSGNFINTIYEDQSQDLWIGTANGLNQFNRAQENFTHYFDNSVIANSQSSGFVTTLCQDYSGIFWVGTSYSGVFRLLPARCKFAHYQSDPLDNTSLRHNYIQALHEDHTGKIWVGTVNGLDALDERTQRFEHHALESGKRHPRLGNVVNTLYADSNGTLWIGTYAGLNQIDHVRRRANVYRHDPADTNSVSSNGITALYEDKSGTLWVGTNAGLNRFECATQNFTRFNLSTEGPANHVLAIHEEASGALWIGTYGGLVRFDAARKCFTRFVQRPNAVNSLSNNYCFAICEDDANRLWIGTGGGLEAFDRATETFTHFTEKDGLPNSVICAIVAGNDGVLWLSTHKGLSRFDTRTHSFKNFDLADGLQSNMFNPGAYGRRKNGAMLFGGVNGFNLFHPDSLHANSFVPPVAITAFKIFDQVQQFAGEMTKQPRIDLAHNQNFFSFEFAALDFTRAEKNQYAYKLEGLDADWIYAGTRRFVGYTNVPPGDYVFRVKGSNNDGIWNDQGAAVRLKISPPFWKTFWFAATCLGMGLALILGLHKYRLRAKLKQFQEVETARRLENESVRKKAANDFHDELGHRLTKIALFSEIVKRQLNGGSPEITGYLDKIIDASHRLVNDTRDFIWTLDPGKDSLYEVILYLKDFAEELFDRTGIVFQLDGLSPTLERLKVSPEAKRQLTLIFKESLNNALKHAGCKTVTLAVRWQDDQLVMALTDDGKGYHAVCNGNGHGLKSMHERAKKIHSDLQIFSTPTGHGTTVQLHTTLNGHVKI